MKFAILMGSPRKHGNTAQCLEPFCDELKRGGAEYTLTWLYDKKIEGCHACRGCQKDWSDFNCVIDDDMTAIAADIKDSDVIVLATPIYSWYCTAPMKALLDRCVYGFNKYYGDEVGPALWAGKKVAVFTTCGYKPEHGADLFAKAYGATASIPGSATLDCLPSGIWDIRPYSWTKEKRNVPEPLPASCCRDKRHIGARSIDLQCEPCYNAVRQDYIESVLHRYEKAHEMAVSWAF